MSCIRNIKVYTINSDEEKKFKGNWFVGQSWIFNMEGFASVKKVELTTPKTDLEDPQLLLYIGQEKDTSLVGRILDKVLR